MKQYDLIVIGTGCGAIIAEEAIAHELKVAIIDKGPLIGGTCLNWGCIPSKQLITCADSIMGIREAERLGITTDIKDIDFSAIMGRMRESRAHSQQHLRESYDSMTEGDFYYGRAHFTGEYTLEVNGQDLRADKIIIATGARPFIPPIKGLEEADYLTNETLFDLEEKPASMIIIGGGYIAVEFAHFFEAVGTRVTVLEMMDRLVLSEEPEIADLLKTKLKTRMSVYTSHQAQEVTNGGKGVTVLTKHVKTGKEHRYTAEKLLVAVGRQSNADLLQVDRAGIETDKRGFIKVNEYMETNRKGIYAVGDANGQAMFTHMANREAAIVGNNLLHDTDMTVDYRVVPHAVYTYPQIASVGLLEKDAREKYKVRSAVVPYLETAKGEAMMEEDGFAKVVLEEETGKLLGFHIVGPEAPDLIQEVVNAMTSGGEGDEINEGIHIHPALSELVPTAINYVMFS